MKDTDRYFPPFKRYDNLGVVLTLYDFFGYLIPGFLFVFGVIVINYFSGGQNATRFFNNILGNWWGIVLLIVISYMVGHFLSGVTKILERIPEYQRHLKCNRIIKGFSRSLFLGDSEPRLAVKRCCSPEIRDRFSYKYLVLVMGRGEENTSGGAFSVLKGMIEEKRLRYSDLIWDSASYLLNNAPAYYNLQYNFLVLAGFFRAASLACFLLICVFILTHIRYPLALTWDIRPWLTIKDLVVFSVLTLSFILSFNRYLKFGRMHNYQIIRSFALLPLIRTSDAKKDD